MLTVLTVCASLHSFQLVTLIELEIFGPGQMLLSVPKLKLSFMGTDRSLPGPFDFGMHYR